MQSTEQVEKSLAAHRQPSQLPSQLPVTVEDQVAEDREDQEENKPEPKVVDEDAYSNEDDDFSKDDKETEKLQQEL